MMDLSRLVSGSGMGRIQTSEATTPAAGKPGTRVAENEGRQPETATDQLQKESKLNRNDAVEWWSPLSLTGWF